MAVAGAGRMAEVHVRALQAIGQVEVVAVGDVVPERARDLATRYRIPRTYSTWEATVEDAEADVVDVVLPHDLHAPAVSRALRGGRHVLCEKPLALTLTEADELVGLAARSGRRLLVKSYQRHAPLNRRLCEAIRNGDLGAPYLALGMFASDQLAALEDPRDWHGDWTRCGGGVLIDAGYHLIDLMHYLFGDLASVDARTRRSVSTAAGKAEDVACLTLEFATGVLATVTATWADSSLPLRFDRQIFGTEASARVVDEGSVSRLTIVAEGGVRETRSHRDWWLATNVAALAELVEDLSEGRRSVAEATEAFRTLRTVLAAYQASMTARRVAL